MVLFLPCGDPIWDVKATKALPQLAVFAARYWVKADQTAGRRKSQ
jgi:hypothetical protein